MNLMKILMVTAEPPGPPRNGIGKFVQEFLPALREKAEVKVLSLQLDPYLIPKEALPKIDEGDTSWADWAYRIENDWYSDSFEGRMWISAHRAYPLVKTILKEFTPDIIYLQSPKVWLPFRYEKNVIMAFHSLGKSIVGKKVPDAGWVGNWRSEADALRRADRAVVFSSKMANELVKNYENVRQPVKLPLGINITEFSPEKNQKVLEVAFFGRLVDSDKGCLSYLDAAKKLSVSGKYSKVTFHVYGEGPDAIPEDYPEVIFHGHVSGADLVSAFNRTHIVVMPSRQEPFGYVGLEAMAGGCLLLCTEGQGMDDYLVPGENYVPIFPEADSIVMNLEKVFQNWSDYQNLILGGLETVSQWTWERSVNRHLEVFEQILQGEKALVEG